MPKKTLIKKSALAPTVLIAGGAGFIGSHLCEALLKRDTRVIVLDDYRSGKEIHVNHLLANPNFALFDVDINKSLPPEIESVDYVIHLAGLEEYLYGRSELTLQSLLTNAIGTKNLLDLATVSKAKFLLVSTTDVYEGMMSQLAIGTYFGSEDAEERKYSHTEAKRYAEALVWEYFKTNNVDARIARLPEIFGPRMDLESSSHLGHFISNLLASQDITILGEGTEKEFYLYVDDAVSGLIKALFKEDTTGAIFSFVPRNPYSILETAFLLKSLADRPVDIKFSSKKYSANPKVHIPDTYSLAIINWEPRVDLKEGLIRTLKSFSYQVNEHSFKQAILVDKKIAEQKAEKLDQNTMSSLQEVKDTNVLLESSYNGTVAKVNTVKEVVEPVKISFGVQPVQKESSNPFLKLKQIFSRVPKEPKSVIVAASIKRGPRNPQRFYAILTSITLVFSFLLVFVIYPLVGTAYYAKKALDNLENVPVFLGKLDATTAQHRASLAKEYFSKSYKSYSSLGWLFRTVNQGSKFSSYSKMLSSMSYFSDSLASLAASSEPFSDIWESIRPNSTMNFDAKNLDDSKLHIATAKNNLQLAQAEFKYVKKDDIPQKYQEKFTIYDNAMSQLNDSFDLLGAVSSNLSDLLGFFGAKNYLILFQNNNEIRPTGGFIGSYALLSLDKGKITNLAIDDIYNPDGQIDVKNIRVTPPKPIGDLLAEDRLYIRNANWDPNFNSSAQTIASLYNKVTGAKIDGVFSVDLFVVKKLLATTGPLFLTAYNEEVNAENLYERTQFHGSFNYKDGSQDKRQFLTVLGGKLLESLFSIPNDKIPTLSQNLLDALNERHMQIHFASSPIQASVAKRGWDGALVKTDKDYLQVVNANLGGTKANYYVKNDMSYAVSSKTRDGLLRADLTLKYNHTGIDESWPGGPYTDYLRVLVQNGSKLTGATLHLNNEEKDIFKDIIIDNVGGYTSFETKFTLLPSSEATLVLSYDLPTTLSISKENTSYGLVWQKQAGTNDDIYSYTFSIPFGMTSTINSANVQYVDGVVSSTGVLNNDFNVMLDLK